MKHALYITCYNHPEMLDRLIQSGLLARVDRAAWDIILFDQSDTLPHQNAYKARAEAGHFERVQNRNGGASEAKRQQIEHAYAQGREIMAQVSEDFVLAPQDAAACGWLASGRQTFFADALSVLEKRPHLAFCNWTFARGSESDFWNSYAQRATTLHAHKVSDLPHVEGDCMAFGWPYTARVHALMKILIEVRHPRHARRMADPDGGEGVLAGLSLGQGASLLAQPVIHDRKPEQRPANRKP